MLIPPPLPISDQRVWERKGENAFCLPPGDSSSGKAATSLRNPRKFKFSLLLSRQVGTLPPSIHRRSVKLSQEMVVVWPLQFLPRFESFELRDFLLDACSWHHYPQLLTNWQFFTYLVRFSAPFFFENHWKCVSPNYELSKPHHISTLCCLGVSLSDEIDLSVSKFPF